MLEGPKAMTHPAKVLMKFERLPFHIGPSTTSTNGDLPDILPFEAGLDPSGIIIQLPNAEVERQLNRAYYAGSMIGTPMSDGGVGRLYADDFLSFVIRSLPFHEPAGLRVLEIGCGNGFLLYQLAQLGCQVIGIEPGEQGQRGSARYGIRVLRETFHDNSALAGHTFDLLLHHGVLEHVGNPRGFLEEQLRYLAEDGRLVFAVPDCGEYIERGDISMFAHEHWSYFSREALGGLLESVGLLAERVEPAGYGGGLYVAATRQKQSRPRAFSGKSTETFARKAQRSIDAMRSFLEGAGNQNQSVGIYCPARALNLLTIIQPAVLLRFFDDDPQLHNHYYPPFRIFIESRQDLLEHSVDHLIIMSRSFGSRLRTELSREASLCRTRFWLPDDILCHLASSGFE